MNMNYAELFRGLGLPDSLIDCTMGRITLPIASMVSPAEWFGFPPALCPVWSDASLPFYLGYWKHWCTSRAATFVTMYVRSGRKVREIARTPDQFLCHAVMTAICVHDQVTPAIKRFASAVGIVNLSEIDKVSKNTGDDPLGYSAISQFKKELPLASVTDVSQYTGEFPTGDFSGSREWWERSCAFEVPDEVLSSWPRDVTKPPWFQAESKAKEFDRLLGAGNYHGAWLTLNSPGWTIAGAKGALARLASAGRDPSLSVLAKAWNSVAQESSGGY
jgi:hypothetical protein